MSYEKCSWLKKNFSDNYPIIPFSFFSHSEYPHIFLKAEVNFTKSAIMYDTSFSQQHC